MKIHLSWMLIGAFSVLTPHVHAQGVANSAAAACKNADPNNANDVYACITRIPELNNSLDGSPECLSVKARAKAYGPEPSCAAIAGALQRFNGKPPYWAACLGYDGSQAWRARCLSSLLTDVKSTLAGQPLYQCDSVNVAVSYVVSMLFEGKKYEATGCDNVKQLLAMSGKSMLFEECLGYVPESSAHIDQCLANTRYGANPTTNFASLSRNPNTPDACFALRGEYLTRLKTVTGTGNAPADYVIPGCGQFEGVLARLASPSPAQAAMPAQPQPQPQPQSNPQPVQAAQPSLPQPQYQQSAPAPQYQPPVQQQPQYQPAPQPQLQAQPQPQYQPPPQQPAQQPVVTSAQSQINNAQTQVNSASQAVNSAGQAVQGVKSLLGGFKGLVKPKDAQNAPENQPPPQDQPAGR